MARKNRTPEENARREKIRELLQMANIGSMDDIQNLFKETIVNIPPQTGQQNGGNRSRVTVEMSPGVRLQVQAVE